MKRSSGDVMNRVLLPLCLMAGLALLALHGCARGPQFDLGLGPIREPREVVQRVNDNVDRMKSLRADIRLRSDEIPQSRLAKATVLFAWPDLYRVKFRTLFGATAAELTVTGQQVNLYMPMSNRLYQGRLTAQQVGRLVGIELAPGDLMEAMLGTVRLPPFSDLTEFLTTADGYGLTYPWGDGRQQVRVASDGVRVQEVVFHDRSGAVVLSKIFEDHRVVDGIVRPGLLRVAFPGQGGELEVRFGRQELNLSWGAEDFQLRVPESVERVLLEGGG
jgi:hypothetical protein